MKLTPPPRVRYFFYIPKIGYFELEPSHPLFLCPSSAVAVLSAAVLLLHFLRGKYDVTAAGPIFDLDKRPKMIPFLQHAAGGGVANADPPGAKQRLNLLQN